VAILTGGVESTGYKSVTWIATKLQVVCISVCWPQSVWSIRGILFTQVKKMILLKYIIKNYSVNILSAVIGIILNNHVLK
jgi:hypothetical protein